MSEIPEVIAKVRRALGRTRPLERTPVPPAIDEPAVRLVHTDFGLSALFARTAAANKMHVGTVYVGELLPRLVEFLRANRCRTVALPTSSFLEKLGIHTALREAGFDMRLWSQMTLDELYDFDCGVTDVYAAIAETGSLVVRSSPEHGRAISLVPPIHVAIVEPRNLVPDLLDLMDKLKREGTSAGTVVISGPSKTADIEMNLITGVHGPGLVQVFVLE